MIEAEFFLEVLMSLFADTADLDGTGKLLDRRVGRQVGEIVFALPGRTMFADLVQEEQKSYKSEGCTGSLSSTAL